MSCTREKIVAQARSWIGCNESDGSHKKIIDVYNSHTPKAVGYTLKVTDAWCSGFASACAIACGATDIIPTEVGCQRHIELFQKMGIWVEDDSYIPLPGDYIFYDWDDNGVGDNKGYSDHVGIVEKTVDGVITVIEGNYSNSVKRRTLKVNGKYIRGYGVPKYDSETVAEDVAEAKPVEGATPVEQSPANIHYSVRLLKLEKGSKGNAVKALQILLIGYGYSCGKYGADGDFGSATLAALVKFQKSKGLDDDGVAGPKTWAVLLGV